MHIHRRRAGPALGALAVGLAAGLLVGLIAPAGADGLVGRRPGRAYLIP